MYGSYTLLYIYIPNSPDAETHYGSYTAVTQSSQSSRSSRTPRAHTESTNGHKHTPPEKAATHEYTSNQRGERARNRALPEEARAPQRAASTLAREEEEGETQRRIQQPTPAEPLRPPVPFSLSGLAFRRSAEFPTPIASPSNRQAHRNNQHTGQEIERRRLGIGTGGRREEEAGTAEDAVGIARRAAVAVERGAMGGNSSRKGALKQRRVGPIRCGPEHADRQAGPSGSGALL